jgi:integrase
MTAETRIIEAVRVALRAEKAVEQPSLETGLRMYCGWAREALPEKSYMKARSLCRSLLAHLGERAHFGDVTQEDLEAWRDWRLRQPGISGGLLNQNTVRKELSLMAGIWDYAVARHWAASNPVRYSRMAHTGVRPPLAARPRRVFGSTEQVHQALALAAGNPTRYAAVYLLAATGIRHGELTNLRKADVDLGNSTVYVRSGGPETTKRHERVIPVGSGVPEATKTLGGHSEWLLTCMDGHHPLTSQLVLWLKPCAMTPHSLRRWYQSTLEDMEAPGYIIDGLMGHVRPSQDPYQDPARWLAKSRKWGEKIDGLLRCPPCAP